VHRFHLSTIFDSYKFLVWKYMERVENVFYSASNLAISIQQSIDSGTRQDRKDAIRLLDEKNRKIAELKLRLAQESHKLRKLQFHWELLKELVNSTDCLCSQISHLQQIFQNYQDDVVVCLNSPPEPQQEFVSRLKKEFPRLSSNDLRICSLLRQNFSTKEIAQNLAIGADSANKARYRIRKKLSLSRKDDLIQFILEY